MTILKDKSRISKTTGKKVTDYVDNEKFTSALHEYSTNQRARVEQGLPQEKIPEYIGACILKIVDGCGSRANFRNYCVDEKTEALTQRGWLSYSDINTDDIILSMDVSTNELKWSRIHEIFVNENYDGKMFKLTGSTIDSLVTPEHKFVTKQRGLVKIDDILCKEHIITMGTGENNNNIPLYSDAFVEIMGWYTTEGSSYKYFRKKDGLYSTYISIHQSGKVNSNKCDMIRKALVTLDPNGFTETTSGDGIINFNISVKNELCGMLLENTLDNKTPTIEFILSLTYDQRILLLSTMMLGDGCGTQYVQKDKSHIDLFVMLCTLCGINTHTSHREWQTKFTMSSCYTVTLSDKKSSYMEKVNMYGGKRKHGMKNNIPTVDYKGTVWCPRTDYGTFVCRRGSKVHVTGNTYLDEMKGDAIIAAVKAVPKFNSEKSKNGYGFINLCVWRDMVNRIVLEKKQQDIKTSMMIDPTIDFFDTMGNNDNNINITKENAVDTYNQGKL